MKRIVCALMVVVWLGTIVGGCQSSNPVVQNQQTAVSSTEDSSQKAWIVTGESSRLAILDGNLSIPAIAAMADSLASWGYSYRPENSVVAIALSVPQAMATDTLVALKTVPDPETWNPISEKDTLVWQVFENAAKDSSRHTAIVTVNGRGVSLSAFLEVDVSSDDPTLIRGMVLSDSGWVINNEVLTGFWSDFGTCMLAASASCALRCLLLGPGYLNCVLGCVGWASIFCSLKAAFGWLKKGLNS